MADKRITKITTEKTYSYKDDEGKSTTKNPKPRGGKTATTKALGGFYER